MATAKHARRMRAAVAEGGRITVRDLAEPEPGPGEVLLSVLACGVCGSDLHHFAGRASDAAPLVYGHEFAAEVVAYGPGASGPAPGTRVCAVPQAGGELVGLSERYPGGFGERLVVAADMLIPIPDHVPTEHAALTEPLAVGAHAVAAAELTLPGVGADRAIHPGTASTRDASPGLASVSAPGSGFGSVPDSGSVPGPRPDAPAAPVALIIGCGPIGLAVLAGVKAQTPDLPVIAADLSPGRRALAARMGADEVVDPADGDPYGRLAAYGVEADPGAGSLRAGDRSGAVIFECVGVPGMLQKVFAGAPPKSRVVVAGACMEPDTIMPVLALVKELRVAFVFGYTRDEFAATLDAIAGGAVDPAPMITGNVGLDGVAEAFTALGDPERHAKILVHPGETP